MLFNILNFAPMALTTEGGETLKIAGWNLYSLICSSIGNVDQVTNAIILLVSILLCIAVGYFIGSINPSIILSKKLFYDDVRNRNHGSKNAGTTNMMRTYGKKMAPIVFCIDFAKAALAIILGALIAPLTWGAPVAALFAVLSHMFPIYYGFKGGKGVSCMMACILLLSPWSFLFIGPVYIAIILIFKYVSLASVIAAMLFPIFAYAFMYTWGSAGFIVPAAFLIGALVVFMHRENLKRLFEGKESKTYFFKKKNAEETAAAPVESIPAKPTEQTESEVEYSDYDFVKCSCGRLIPITRKKCIYCNAENTSYTPDIGANRPEKSKKSMKKSNKSKKK